MLQARRSHCVSEPPYQQFCQMYHTKFYVNLSCLCGIFLLIIQKKSGAHSSLITYRQT